MWNIGSSFLALFAKYVSCFTFLSFLFYFYFYLFIISFQIIQFHQTYCQLRRWEVVMQSCKLLEIVNKFVYLPPWPCMSAEFVFSGNNFNVKNLHLITTTLLFSLSLSLYSLLHEIVSNENFSLILFVVFFMNLFLMRIFFILWDYLFHEKFV